MWRHAHGLLTLVLVVLSGDLWGCAPGPATPPQHARTHLWPDPDDEPHDPPCGGDEPRQELTPEERRANFAKAIEHEASRCRGEVEAAGRHGEALVTIRGNNVGQLAVGVTADPGLTIEDQRCIEAVVRSVAQLGDAWGGDLANDLQVELAFGTWPPLFPPAGKLTREWVAAMHTKAARKRFVAKLPAEVVLRENDCLSIPRRRSFNDRLDHWLDGVEMRVDEFWQSSSKNGFKRGLLDEIGPSGGMPVRAYWLGGRAVLLHRGVVADPRWQEICLVPLDETLRQKIRFAIDDRGTCWVGGLDEIVLHPRAEFPTDRRFQAVAVAATHACALDDAGTPVCCGERFHDDPPTGPLSALAVGAEFDCGLEAEGALRCWGHDPPGGGVAITGPFEQIAISGRDLCAVRRERQSLECWRPDVARMAPAPDRWSYFNSIVAAERRSCTVAADRRVACDPDWPFGVPPGTPAL